MEIITEFIIHQFICFIVSVLEEAVLGFDACRPARIQAGGDQSSVRRDEACSLLRDDG